MSKVFKEYQPQLDVAPLVRAPGARFENAPKAYFACRKVEKVHALQGPTGVRYQGKLDTKRAMCLGFLNPSVALAARKLAYACDQRPSAPDLVQLKGQHKGQVGLLYGSVSCYVLQSFENI